MSDWNLDKIIPCILESGRIALSYFDSPVREFKKDHSIVTIADRSVEAFLTAEFDKPEEGSYLLGEETIENKEESYLEDAFRRDAWIVDPVDGTAPFSNNLPTWGVSIGWMHEGVLKEGAVFLPALGELYYTDRGHVFREKTGMDSDLWKSRPGLPRRLDPPAHREIERGSILSISQQMSRRGAYRLPNYIQVTGSTVYNLVKLFSGSYGAVITKFKLWDFAGCLPMAAALGWTMEFRRGGSMDMDMRKGMILREKENPRRWEALDEVIFAPSPEAAAYLRTGTSSEA